MLLFGRASFRHGPFSICLLKGGQNLPHLPAGLGPQNLKSNTILKGSQKKDGFNNWCLNMGLSSFLRGFKWKAIIFACPRKDTPILHRPFPRPRKPHPRLFLPRRPPRPRSQWRWHPPPPASRSPLGLGSPPSRSGSPPGYPAPRQKCC